MDTKNITRKYRVYGNRRADLGVGNKKINLMKHRASRGITEALQRLSL